MIDHTGVSASDAAASIAFYQAALAPIGYQQLVSFEAEDGSPVAGFGVAPKPDFWVAGGRPSQPPTHVAFVARTRAEVDAFHAAALGAGGTDHGAPGLRPHYHADYYAAFVLDLDGYNIEAVCHAAP
jgi:catechol 2,3-dioxygenase-like lactoylglutathione lyase family enzyme